MWNVPPRREGSVSSSPGWTELQISQQPREDAPLLAHRSHFAAVPLSEISWHYVQLCKVMVLNISTLVYICHLNSSFLYIT